MNIQKTDIKTSEINSEGPQIVGDLPDVGLASLEKAGKSLNIIQTPCEILCRPSWNSLKNQIHFRNACRQQPSQFSCAVDCFLELAFSDSI